MATEQEKKLFVLVRASVGGGVPILVDPKDSDLIPDGEKEQVGSVYFSKAPAPAPDKAALYDSLRRLSFKDRVLGIPAADAAQEQLSLWNQAHPKRKFVFKSASPYPRPGSTPPSVYYVWIVDELTVTHFPKNLE